jgi:hypothetical protein
MRFQLAAINNMTAAPVGYAPLHAAAAEEIQALLKAVVVEEMWGAHAGAAAAAAVQCQA